MTKGDFGHKRPEEIKKSIREIEKRKRRSMIVVVSLSSTTICGGVVELNYHLWWCGLHGAMAKLERERTIMVVVCGSYGLLEITMRFWGIWSKFRVREGMRKVEMRGERDERYAIVWERGEREERLKWRFRPSLVWGWSWLVLKCFGPSWH